MKSEVSAFMDGALEDGSQAHVVNTLCRDSRLRRVWSEYHLIGDALRRSPRLSFDVAHAVMSRLADEPTVLAPAHATGRRHGVWRYALPLAASVMGVGAVAWIAQTLNPPHPATVAVLAPQVPPQQSAAPAAGDKAELAKLAQDKPYLFAHQGYSAASSIQGFANYVRIVSDTREGAAR